ncbi:MAG: hypothetical protein IIX41_07850, partial [Bacteroidales bacterium]|nr:hypothetical protein [Bacteroidales bacterium]
MRHPGCIFSDRRKSDGSSAMIAYATSGYFVVHCCCLAVPLYHSLPDLYTFLEGTSTLSDFPDEAVREG